MMMCDDDDDDDDDDDEYWWRVLSDEEWDGWCGMRCVMWEQVLQPGIEQRF